MVKAAKEAQSVNMAKLKDFITALAKKAGYDTESEAAKPFFAAVPDFDVPDDVSNGIDRSLISLSEAKNNFPDIKNHYYKSALDGVDNELKTLMEDFKLEDTLKNEILGEKSSYKRIPMLTRKLVEAERLKVAATSGKDKGEIQKQIDDLQSQLLEAKTSLENEKKSFEQQRLQDRINNKKNVLYSGLKTIHDELDPDVKYGILDTLVTRALQDSSAKLALDDNGNLSLLRSDGTNFFGENHQQLKPVQFIEQILAKNKQIKVTPTNGQNNPGGTQNPAQPTNSGGGGDNKNKQQSLIEANAAALETYNKAMQNGQFGVSV